MPNPHIVIDTNEIRMTDDDGSPSLHILRPTYLDAERYFWFPFSAVAQTKQGVTNSSVLVSHTELTIPVQAGARYSLSGFIEWDATGSMAQQLAFNLPANSSGRWSAFECISGSGTAYAVPPAEIAAPVDGLTGLGANDFQHWTFHGWFVAGGNGNITAQFARDSAGVANQTIYINPGSYFTIQRIA